MDTGARASPRPPGPLPPAPQEPLPAGFGLRLEPDCRIMEGGTVLVGGSPLRLLRMRGAAATVVQRWREGAPVSPAPAERRLARRLVEAGMVEPVPRTPGDEPPGAPQVTAVVPVLDRPDALRRLLAALDGLPSVVVDDASADDDVLAGVTQAGGASLVRLRLNAGPGGARNRGLEATTSPLVAFIDSDCVPEPGWLAPLLEHFADPMVAAAAPRVVRAGDHPATGGRDDTGGWWAGYDAVRSPLDRGPRPGAVRPGTRIPFVPTAALVVRRAALGTPCFDEALRGGEDVDLVWRLVEAGWTVRYVPTSVVRHHGREGPRGALTRRFFYGTTGGPLARRHPDALAPFSTSAWTLAAWGLVLGRRPGLGLAAAGWSAAVLGRRLQGVVTHPGAKRPEIAGVGTLRAASPALSGLFRAWGPAIVAGLGWRRSRVVSLLALVVPPLADWHRDRPAIDPLRYAVAHVADDLAYSSGLWVGCARARTLRPLLPRVVLRQSQWRRESIRRTTPLDETPPAPTAGGPADRPTGDGRWSVTRRRR